jgi:hypothetical protein
MGNMSQVDPSTPRDRNASTARLTLRRTSEADARQRQVYMSLDDERIATLLFGDEVTREIPAGRHRLRANNTLVWKTVEFDAAPGADLQFDIVNRAAPGMLWMVALFGAGPMLVSLEPATAASTP